MRTEEKNKITVTVEFRSKNIRNALPTKKITFFFSFTTSFKQTFFFFFFVQFRRSTLFFSIYFNVKIFLKIIITFSHRFYLHMRVKQHYIVVLYCCVVLPTRTISNRSNHLKIHLSIFTHV